MIIGYLLSFIVFHSSVVQDDHLKHSLCLIIIVTFYCLFASYPTCCQVDVCPTNFELLAENVFIGFCFFIRFHFTLYFIDLFMYNVGLRYWVFCNFKISIILLLSVISLVCSNQNSFNVQDQTTKKYYFVVANAKFMLDEEEHFKELMNERLRLFGERNKEQDFWLVIEPKFLDKFPNITKRLKRPAVALVSTNGPWIT